MGVAAPAGVGVFVMEFSARAHSDKTNMALTDCGASKFKVGRFTLKCARV